MDSAARYREKNQVLISSRTWVWLLLKGRTRSSKSLARVQLYHGNKSVLPFLFWRELCKKKRVK
jgi:hypothetical protein